MILDSEDDREILLMLVNDATTTVRHAEAFLALRDRIADAEINTDEFEAEELPGIVVASSLSREEAETRH